MQEKGWGPWGLGQWRGHPNVYCRVCGWPVYSLWVDKEPPPGDCTEGKSDARSCPRVLDMLMTSAWVRATTGKTEPHEATEMLRKVTRLSWEDIEKMCDASGRSVLTVAELKARATARAALSQEEKP